MYLAKLRHFRTTTFIFIALPDLDEQTYSRIALIYKHMTMSTPAAKRRRIDAATQALSKPFRSPLKIPLSATTSEDPPAKNLQDLDHSLPTTDATKGLAKPFAPPFQNMRTPFRGNPIKKSFSPSSTVMNSDPEIALLLKTQHQLEKQMRELKDELETSEQARKIEAESEKKCPGREIDAELMDLIAKWRVASRHVAEELFTGVRDRVNRYA
jgi:Swi5-dependent recombination DNA repair protein 1